MAATVQHVSLKSITTYFVGGDTAVIDGLPVEYRSMVLNGAPRQVDPNGEFPYGQMYVQEYRLANPRHPLPVLLWHGGGMTGCTWETTPDGRPGWLWLFLQAGYDVIVSDAAERGRSSWARFPHIYSQEPVFRNKKEAWLTFRIGPAYATDPAQRQAYDGQLFPIDGFDAFANQWVPRWPGHETMILRAYEALIDRVGPCHIVGHSQGAGFAAEIARRRPASVHRIVCLEPGGMPEPVSCGALPPHLVVWGDYIEQSGSHWVGYRQQAQTYLQAIRDDAQITVWNLPELGIPGNSHLPMMDRNSADIFLRVIRWLNT